MSNIEQDTYKKQEEKKQPLKHEQKKNRLIGLGVFLTICIILAIVFGDPFGSNSNKTGCPKQGIMQSDRSYCLDLCMYDKEEGASSRTCEQVCDSADRLDGSYGTEHMDKTIQIYKCTKWGECTEEQLKSIEEKKKQKEEAEISYQKTIEEAKIKKEEEERIKEEQQKIQEQARIKLEKNIESQSEKLGGYVYIKNISGEPRQYQENGILYDFPVQQSVKVPMEIGRNLLSTGQFELVMV